MTLLRSAVTQPSTPTLGVILWRDLTTLVATITLLGLWITTVPILTLGYLPLYVGRVLFTLTERRLILALTIVLSLLLLSLIIWRFRRFRSVLVHGIPVTGQVSRLTITPLEYRVEYVFNFQDRPRRGMTAIRRSTLPIARSSLEPGRTGQVLVHKYLPDRSLMLRLYRAT